MEQQVRGHRPDNQNLKAESDSKFWLIGLGILGAIGITLAIIFSGD